MSDDPLTSLIDLRNQVVRRQKELFEQAAAMDKVIKQLSEAVTALQQAKSKSEKDTGEFSGSRFGEDQVATRYLNPPKEEVAVAVRAIIEREGRPVSRRDLFDRLAEQGIQISGADPYMVLSTMLWRAGKDAGLVRLTHSPRGYWLAERDFPPAGYFAPNE